MIKNYKKVFDVILLTFICTLLLIPIILLILFSLQTFESITNNNWNHWTMENYSTIMDGFLPSLIFTILIIIFSSLFTLIVSITAAFAMSQLEFKHKKIITFFILIPICIPGASIIASEYKLITLLGMTTNGFSFVIGLSLPFCYSYLSYAILKSGYDNNINVGLKNVARTNNISTWDYFLLTIESVKNEIIWVILLTCISSWNSYLYPRIILMGTDFKVITLWLYKVSIDTSDMIIHDELQAAASIVATTPLIIFFITFRKKLINIINKI